MYDQYRLFTTGAFVVPEVKISGIETWRWIVDSFEDDSFFAGNVFNSPEYATDLKQLITVSDDA